jgi:hypothetical protein
VTVAGGVETPLVITYSIDGDDVLTGVGGHWADFARSNGASDLADPPADRDLWSYLAGDDVRAVWRLLVRRVRAGGATIAIPIRCDAPHALRWFDLTLAAGDRATVHFRSVLRREEPRAPSTPTRAPAPAASASPLLRVCSWCTACHDGVRWVPVDDLVRNRRIFEAAAPPALTHGICPSCRRGMRAGMAESPGATG